MKIVELLEETLSPLITNISFNIELKDVDTVIPNPKKIPYILKNEPVNFYVTFKKPLTKTISFNLSYDDPIS